jgi:hypothetical protein
MLHKPVNLLTCLIVATLTGVFSQADSQGSATNGQMILFAAINARITSLEVSGLNQRDAPSIWHSPTIPERGLSLLLTDGWWWKGRVELRFKLLGGTQKSCVVGTVARGFFITLVTYSAQGNACVGDQGNNGDPQTKALEVWLNTRIERDPTSVQWLSAHIADVDDGYACLIGLTTASKAAGPSAAMPKACLGWRKDLLEQLLGKKLI